MSPTIDASTSASSAPPSVTKPISSNGDGTLTIVQEMGGKYEVVENVATARGARTIALDEKTHNVYLPLADALPPQPGQRRGGFVPDSFKVIVVGK